ncbi:MAG TPA: HAMP domain-containing sensor histidine kinase [Allosphingosinicella sp.]|nr:HAMP domain-containing sensor histidine kinase [Allosphingosinicella sp.]
MKRGASVLGQVGGLAITALIAAILISFGAVLLTPTPGPRLMTVADAAAALQGETRPGLERVPAGEPPAGRASGLIGRAVAARLGVPEARVRAVWLPVSGAAGAPPPRGQTVMIVAGQDVVVDSQQGGFTMRSGTDARVSPEAPVPPFEVGLRQADGRWLLVRPVDSLFAAWRLRILAAFLLGIVLLAPLVWLIARRLTRPVRTLAEAAARTQLWQDGEAVPLEGPREVRAAAEAFNAMQARIRSEARERVRILAAVAHDLRNPLTGLRIRAEASPEPERSRMIADLDRMAAMISQVLDYVRGREIRERRVPVDIAELVRACAEALPAQACTVAEPLPPVLVLPLAEPEGLRRAFLNLIDNALRYAGDATLSVAREDDDICLIVDDTGPGLPGDSLGRLTEPFERLEDSRNRDTGGAGLGLAIARDVAERHGGRLLLENRAGGGLRAAICLPARGLPAPPGE